MYEYRATVTNVYDGDTATVNIDLGFDVILTDKRLRLRGVDTPEIRNKNLEEKKRAYEARDFVRAKIAEVNNIIFIRTHKSGKYGRYITDIWLNAEDAEEGKWETTLNNMLLENNLAVEFMKND